MPWAGLAGALAVDGACILLMYVALGLGPGGRKLGMVVAGLAVAVAPRLVGGPTPFVRFLMGLVSVILIAKFYDLGVGARRRGAGRPGWRDYLAFLPNVFGLVYRTLDAEPQPPPAADRARLLRGLAGLAAGLVVAAVVFGVDWGGTPLALEHPVKVVALYAPLLALDAVGVSLWRLAGGRGRQLMRHPYAARTPADFWRRYNRPVNHFLEENVFRPSGPRGSPVMATLAAFVASGALHEYLFAVTLGRVEGFQSAFFLIQGGAVAATLRVRPRGPLAAAGVALTWAFMLASSVLFFASLGGVVPFYAAGRPAWLRPRA